MNMSRSLQAVYLKGGVVRDHDSSIESENEYQPIPVSLEAGIVKNDVRRRLGHFLSVVRD